MDPPHRERGREREREGERERERGRERGRERERERGREREREVQREKRKRKSFGTSGQFSKKLSAWYQNYLQPTPSHFLNANYTELPVTMATLVRSNLCYGAPL